MKDDFYIHDSELCYLDGNSLGRLPKAAERRVQQVVREGWGTDLIGGWNKDWIHLPRRLGDKIAEVIGASAGEVIVADSTRHVVSCLASRFLLSVHYIRLLILFRSNSTLTHNYSPVIFIHAPV